MDWDDLRIFLAVARSESLSGAGKRLKIDAATVGRRIARLEESMGARLFAKSPQGYALTEEGTRLLPHAAAGRLTVQKLTDYRLHLAAHPDYLAHSAPLVTQADLNRHRLIGYIPDMIHDKELDYLSELGAGTVALASNSVSVQLNWLRAGAGVGVVHDFALPAAPELIRLIPDQVALTRSFWLIRHADDGRVARLNRFADLLAQGLRREVARLEALATRA